MTTVARIPREGHPRRPARPAPVVAERAARIRQWYASMPEDEMIRLMHDVGQLVRDVAPAFTDQAARLPESESVSAIVERAFVSFVSYLDNPSAAENEIGPLFGRIGRQMASDGVEIDTMRRALEEASTLIVVRLEHLLDRYPLSASLAVHLVSVVTGYLAQLRDYVQHGHGVGRPDEEGWRRDRALVFRLLSTGATVESIAAFTERTGITVASRVMTVVVVGSREPLHSLPPLEDLAYLPAGGPLSEMLLPEADLAALTDAAAHLRGATRLIVGPVVPASRARESFAVARSARGHLDSGALPRTPVLRCDEYLVELMLLSDHVSLSSLVERRLAPLAQLPERDREQYAAVLYAVLSTGKSVRQLARDLHYHQQTLQSRVNRLKAVYGDDLDDPDARLEIMLAVRHIMASSAR